MNSLKRPFAGTLCTAMLCLSFGALPAQAAAGTDSTIQEIIGALDIITGDAAGNLNLTKNVTRAEFAKMLVSASTYKDTVSAAGNSSPFQDVPYTHWAANYIKTAVAQGWLTGYLDGTYRPNNTITCAEAATAVLKLLNYGPSDFSGTFPYAQMALYQALDLDDEISAASATPMSRRDCMRLFYNLLSVPTNASDNSNRQVYAQTLGYALDENGDPDYDDILKSNMNGPLILTNSLNTLLSFTPTTVYRNDSLSSVSALQSYDVIYYSQDRKTVWAYARRITGTLQTVAPNRQNPTSVTVAGSTYALSGSLATSTLGANGGLAIGTNVTLLLGKDGNVVAAYSADILTKDSLIGIITDIDKSTTYTAADGTTYTQPSTTLLATDGQSYTLQAYDSNLTIGNAISVTFGASQTTLTRLTNNNSLTGTVDANHNAIGTYAISPEVEILDATQVRGTKTYLSRMDGLTLSSDDVKYYEKNAANEVTKIILNDLTGDTYTYGLLRSSKSDDSTESLSISYTFQLGDALNTYTQLGNSLGCAGYSGPIQIEYDGNGKIVALQKLHAIEKITSATSATIENVDGTHTLSDNVVVYRHNNDNYQTNYYVMDRNAIDSSQYSIAAYYDKNDCDGGRVRVVILKEK